MKSFKNLFFLSVSMILLASCASVGPELSQLKADVENEVFSSKAFHDEEATWDKKRLKDLKLDVQCAPILLSAHHIRESVYYPSFAVQYGPYLFQRTDVGNREGKFQVRYSNGQFICNLGVESSTQFWYLSKDQSVFAFHEMDKVVQVTKFSVPNSCGGEYTVVFKGDEWADLIKEWRDLPPCEVGTDKRIQQ